MRAWRILSFDAGSGTTEARIGEYLFFDKGAYRTYILGGIGILDGGLKPSLFALLFSSRL